MNSSRWNSLLGHLRDKELLLVFDNCDHLSAAIVQLIEHLFVEAPLVHVLVSSRVALRLQNGSAVNRG